MKNINALLITLFAASIIQAQNSQINNPSKKVEEQKPSSDTVYYAAYEIKYKNGMFQMVQYPYQDNIYDNLGGKYRHKVERIDTIQYKVAWKDLNCYWSQLDP